MKTCQASIIFTMNDIVKISHLPLNFELLCTLVDFLSVDVLIHLSDGYLGYYWAFII
jgi:hypothetical protein